MNLKMNANGLSEVLCENEWSPLKEVIVGRAEYSHFPSEPRKHIQSIMPAAHLDQFRPGNAFPQEIIKQADKELNDFASMLELRGIKVHRPALVDWGQVGSYTGSMPRDALLVVGNTIIESYFAWNCRRKEVRLAYSNILEELENSGRYKVVRAPTPNESCDLYKVDKNPQQRWQINDSRPAFDAADFIRCGSFLVGQQSHVTNLSSIEYVRANLPSGYRIVLPEIDCPSAMHIDATFLPLREGLAIYNPLYTCEKWLRQISPLDSWQLVSIGKEPRSRAWPPLYMTSPEIRMNILSLNERTVLVEEDDLEMARMFHSLGMDVITLPFKHVQCLGGSFHCATVDLRRSPSDPEP